jgi:hypothetical protein
MTIPDENRPAKGESVDYGLILVKAFCFSGFAAMSLAIGVFGWRLVESATLRGLAALGI